MNNKMVVQPRLDVVNQAWLNLLNIPNATTTKAAIEDISGVTEVAFWPQSDESLCVHFVPARRVEVFWAIKGTLDELGLNYGIFGDHAPQVADWSGYKEVSPHDMLGVEQRTKGIRQNYQSFKSRIAEANKLAWQMGMMLSQQREVVKHNKCGGFEGWLAAEFPDWHIKTAQRFIYIYECYSNMDTVSMLEVGLGVMYKLSAPSTPESAREEIQERAEQGEKITQSVAAEIIASHKITIPDSLMWLPERLRKAVINGYFNLSVDHLQALSPLEGLNTIGAPMLGVSTFDKRTDIPTPQALYNRLSTIGGLSADEVQTVVSRMVAVCKPSENEVDLSDFTEADFAELGVAGEGEASEKRLDETGIKGYFFVNGGKAVWCEFSNKTLTLDEFEEIKAKHAKPRKSASHLSGNGSGGHVRTAAEIQGDRIATGMVAQVERANTISPRQFMINELSKMDEGALTLLSAAIAKAVGDDTIFNQIYYIADFATSEVGGEAKS